MFTLIEQHHRKIIVALLAFFVVVSALNIKNDGITYDEVAHIPAGYTYITYGDYRINPEHPPLLKVLAALPLLAIDITFDRSLDFWHVLGQYGEFDQWAAGRHLLFEAGNNTDAIVWLARIPTLIIAAFFSLFLFRWGRERIGIVGGLLVYALYIFDPNILGHNHYVTTDLGIAVAITLAFYYFLRFLKDPSWHNVLIGGIFLGIAQITKFSAVILVPFFGLLLIIYALTRDTGGRSRTAVIGSYLGKGLCAIGVTLVLIYVTYIPMTIGMGPEVLDQIGPGRITNTELARNRISLDFVLTMNESALTRPIGMYAQGVIQVFHRVAGGNGVYFLEDFSYDASPSYFPTIFLLKNTIPHLIFYAFGIFLFVVFVARSLRALTTQSLRDSWTRITMFIQTHFTPIALALFILFYSYISITGNLNIGFRHLFPIVPLLYLLVAEAAHLFLRRMKNKHTALHLRVVGLVVLALMAVETARAYPFYMSYFNQFAGGSHNGFNYVADSNADWGQDMRRLDDYLNEHLEIDKVRFNYFGGDRPERFLGKRFEPWWDSRHPIEKGYYAMSTNFLQESLHDKTRAREDSYHWLFDLDLARSITPDINAITFIDQVGTSIMIYKVE